MVEITTRMSKDQAYGIEEEQYIYTIFSHNKETLSSILSKLHINWFKIDLPKSGSTYMCNWVICGPKHHKEKQLESLEQPGTT